MLKIKEFQIQIRFTNNNNNNFIILKILKILTSKWTMLVCKLILFTEFLCVFSFLKRTKNIGHEL